MTQLELFTMFCGSDSIRPVMTKPFELNDKVYATDAHKLIRCNKSECEFEISNHHKPVNPERVFPEITCHRVVSTKMEEFDRFKIADELVKVGEDIDCSECNGNGEVTWEYKLHEKEDECPVCKGSGSSSESRLVPNGKKTFADFAAYTSIDGTFFNINILYKIFEVQKFTGGDIVLLNVIEEGKPAHFKIGIYDVIIMPIMNSDNIPSLLDISFVK